MTRFGARSIVVRIAAAAAFAVWVPTAAPSGAQAALPGSGERWIDVQTANFRIFSNAGKSPTRRVAADLEELRATLAELTDFELHSPVPTFIFIFKNERSFTPFKILYNDQPGNMSGYFINGEHANFIAIDAGARDASAIVYHEYVHYVMANNYWWLPVWLSEGLAEFYQTFDVVKDTVFIGLPINGHLARLSASSRIPLAEILAVDRESPLYNEKDRKSAFYAECWALTHYLLLGNEERRDQLGSYLTLVSLGVPTETAFVDAFGADLDKLEGEARGHTRGPRIPFLKTKTAIDVDTSMSIQEMDSADVLYRLGTLLASQQPVRSETTVFFEAALEADPDHSFSLTALALKAEERADWETASQLYLRAVRANPDDPQALFHWGEFLGRRGSYSEQALVALNRATSLDPSFAPAWAALSNLYVQRGITSPEAIVAAETAHRLEPANEQATRNLLRLYLRLDHRSAAADLIDHSMAANPKASREAWTALLQNDLFRAREMLHEDRLSQASNRLDRAEQDVHRSVRPQIIERGVADIRRSISEHEGTRTYDLAFARYEDGDTAAARSLLEQALSSLPTEGPVAASCRHLLDVIDHPEKYEVPSSPAVSPTRDEIEQLNRLLAAGELESAHDFLVGIREQSHGAQERWIEDKIEELQRTLDYNRSVEIYNAAVERYNRQEFEAVVAMLDEFLANTPEGPQTASVRTLRNDAQREIDNRSGGRR